MDGMTEVCWMDDNFQVEYTNDTYTEEDEGGIHRGGTYAQSWYQAWVQKNPPILSPICASRVLQRMQSILLSTSLTPRVFELEP